jgi:hypothetical protein
VTRVRHARRPDPLYVLRASLAALTALGIAGTAFELASLRHWNGAVQLVPWFALLVLAAALVLYVRLEDRVRWVRGLGLLVLVASGYGMWEHVLVNYESGPLDQRFADTWTELSLWSQWWYAIARTVGPAPTLAPGMLAQAAATLVLATLARERHPVPEHCHALTTASGSTGVAVAGVARHSAGRRRSCDGRVRAGTPGLSARHLR